MRSSFKLPLLLYSYLATEMLAPFFASLLIMNGVFFLVKLIPFLNFVLKLNIGVADFIRLFSYLFPNIFLYAIPMAAMMGVTIGFARLSSDTEILAFKASGISMFQILPPVILVTGMIALLTGYISIKLIPFSEVAMKQLTYQLLKEQIDSGIQEHVFTEALGDVVVYVDKIDKETGEWSNVWVSDMRGVQNPTITMASTGYMESNAQEMMVSIILRNGSLHHPDTQSAQIVEFDRYQINIPLTPPQSKATTLKKRNALSMTDLRNEAMQEGGNIEEKRKFLIEFHKRLVLPFGCLMLSLLGLPLGLQARPGKKAIGIQSGLAIFVLYYILFTVGKTMAEEGVVPIALAMWTPNLLFFCLAIFWIYRVANEKSLFSERLINLLLLLRGRIRAWTFGFFSTLRRALFRKEPADKQSESPAPSASIRGDAKQRIFHLPGCIHYDCPGCTISFKDRQVALEAGFEPCPLCSNSDTEQVNKLTTHNAPASEKDDTRPSTPVEE